MRSQRHDHATTATTGPTRATPRRVMWAAIGLSVLLLGLLLAFGWGHDAWAAAAGFLFVACVAACVWAGVRSSRM
jgi:hypothetical protein